MTKVLRVWDLLYKTYDAIVQGMGQNGESSAGETELTDFKQRNTLNAHTLRHIAVGSGMYKTL